MSDKNESVLWFSVGDRVFLGVVAPVVGGLLGFFLPRVAGWATTLAWVPFQGPLELVSSWSDWWVRYVFTVGGVMLGAAFVAFVLYNSVKIVVAEVGIRLTENGETREISRSAAATVFLDGKELVVLDGSSRQIVRTPVEERSAAVQQAFVSHGYSFVKEDPYSELYRRWVPDTPSLPDEINAVMRARAKFLEKKATADARELRRELDRNGIVVRDSKSRQYWRPLVRR
ncbi:hypothetical protein QMK17_05030 [Rhodococcus sp. G-MC3]|uniref:YqeB family protein n=1 Tax=Rhodococcus sp. G-MC3 TaxID=3046209 RepID=UPI0024B9928C|nr:hypothetical protein [Rhodococcus sp. G-MC3]MDJ0392689.1 hypothetical protein [Rhodococcus sp. G-MC3]